MGNEIKPTGQGSGAPGAVSMPGFGQKEVAVDKEKKAAHTGATVLPAEQPIESRDVEKGLTTAEKLDKLSGIVNKLTSKKPVDVQQVEGDLKGFQEELTIAYEVVNLMGDGEEIGAVKQFLENVLSIIKSLLIFVGIMKQVDDKGNLAPEKQMEADHILKDVEHKMEELGAQEKPKPKASAPPPPPPMPPATGSRPKTSSPAAEPPAVPPMPSIAQQPKVAAKSERDALLAQIQAGTPLKKAEPQVKQEEKKTFIQDAVSDIRGAVHSDDDDAPPEEFEDNFYVPEPPKAPTPPPVTKKEAVPTQSVVKRPMAAPADLLSAIREGRGLNKVEQENKPPVQTQKSQKDVFAGSKVLQQAQQMEPDDDGDKWED